MREEQRPLAAYGAPLGLGLLALGWRVGWSRTAPPGMNHDAADNILAAADPDGLGLLFTQTHGMAKEPLFHALLRPLLDVLPPDLAMTSLAIFLGSLAAPAAWLCLGAAGLHRGRVASTLWLALGAWPVLYSLVGFRVIVGLPLAFLAMAGTLQLQRQLRQGARPRAALPLATGLLLGVGLYAYTTAKLIALACILWLLLQLGRLRPEGMRRVLGLLILGLVPALPWLVALTGDGGGEVLARGSYVFRASGADAWRLLIDCLLLPLYLSEQYGHISGSSFISDGAAVVFPLTGALPIALPASLLILIGLAPGRADHGRSLAILLYLLHVGILGAAGPSTTRFLLAVPALCLLMARGTENLLDWLERLKQPAVTSARCSALILGTLVLGCGLNTMRALGTHERAWVYFPAAISQATELGLSCPLDRTPVVVVPHSRSVVRVGALERPDMQAVEFYREPGTLALAELSQELKDPVFILVIHERTQTFAADLIGRWPSGTFQQTHGPSDVLHRGVVVFDPQGG